MTDTCRPVTVTGDDGQPITVSVLGAAPMTAEDLPHFEALVQAAQRRYAAEHPGPPLCTGCSSPLCPDHQETTP
jgi:hypothetical protein